MANLASKIRRASHEHERHDRQHRHGRNEPSCRTAAAPGLPQGDPRDEAGELRHGESGERRVLVDSDGIVGDLRLVPQLLMGADAAHIDGKRQDRDHEEHFQPRMFQGLVTPDEGQEQEAQGDDRTDGGHVVQQQMQMGDVDGCDRRHVPPMGPGRREDGPR